MTKILITGNKGQLGRALEKLCITQEVSAVGELMPTLSVVNGAQSRFHRLVVKVTAYGGNAADAYAVGPIVAEPIVIAGESREMEQAVAV